MYQGGGGKSTGQPPSVVPGLEEYPFLEMFVDRVDDIDNFINNIKKEKQEYSFGVFLNGPYAF